MNENFDVLRQYVQGNAVEHSKLIRAIGFVLDFTIELHERSDKIRTVDNGDGTVTIRGLPVTIPSTLIPEGEVPVEVRSVAVGMVSRRWLQLNGSTSDSPYKEDLFPGDLRITFADKPLPVTWAPPASLPDGEYVWKEGELWNCHSKRMIAHVTIEAWLGADFTVPPKEGRYRKDGTIATWIGE
jgi:hypothetical protein